MEGFISLSFNELVFSSCHCSILQEGYIWSVCWASGSGGGESALVHLPFLLELPIYWVLMMRLLIDSVAWLSRCDWAPDGLRYRQEEACQERIPLIRAIWGQMIVFCRMLSLCGYLLVWLFSLMDQVVGGGGGSHFSVHSIFVPESIPSVTVFQHSNQSVIH